MSLIEYYILAVIAFCVLGKGPKEVSEETDRDSTQVAMTKIRLALVEVVPVPVLLAVVDDIVLLY